MAMLSKALVESETANVSYDDDNPSTTVSLG